MSHKEETQKSMRQFSYIFFFLLILISLLFADATIMEFSGEPSRDKIILKWKTGEEVNVALFIVERSINNKNFVKVGEVQPKGSNSSYQFTDNTITDSKTIFFYRLRIRNQDGSAQLTESISVIPKISSLARTWGSIKALFQ